jgi:hypothetical protein
MINLKPRHSDRLATIPALGVGGCPVAVVSVRLSGSVLSEETPAEQWQFEMSPDARRRRDDRGHGVDRLDRGHQDVGLFGVELGTGLDARFQPGPSCRLLSKLLVRYPQGCPNPRRLCLVTIHTAQPTQDQDHG